MIKKKRKGKEKKIIYRESGSKMNGLLTPALTSPHSKHHPIYLFRKYSNVSRKVSGPVVGSVKVSSDSDLSLFQLVHACFVTQSCLTL